ncbi:hypothetical protein AB0J38_38125 [Streptomyces sp. NPDC050095]|uniref:hypothetical protein n=1 Tax=unclassified Streptomyces TaxID=2593676 RepID=UPI00342FFDAC
MTLKRLPTRLTAAGALALACAATVLTGTGHADAPHTLTGSVANPATARGSVVSATQVADLSARDVAALLQQAGIEPYAGQVRHGVRAHRIVYRTVDPQGRPTTASALVAVPENSARTLRAVSWLHGTEVFRGEVASVNDASADRATALLFASSGFAVSAPDYLGLGTGPGLHPYGDPGATVTASVDALRATRAFVRGEGRALRPDVAVAGFSQGGPATMLVGRALQEGADPFFRPAALTTVAGPFHLSAFEAAAAADRLDRSPLYLAYFTTAWNRLYGLYDSPEQAFRAPYADRIETLFDGNHTGAQIAEALPATSKELFTEEFLRSVRHPTGELRRRLRALDTACDWRPDVPVHLFHATGDRDVPVAHSAYCGNRLAAAGATYRLTDVGKDVDHSTTVLRALPDVVREFHALG